MEITAHFGDLKRKVKIIPVPPSRMEYQLMIDDYYKGTFRHIGGKWVIESNNPGEFSAGYIKVLVELISKKNRNRR